MPFRAREALERLETGVFPRNEHYCPLFDSYFGLAMRALERSVFGRTGGLADLKLLRLEDHVVLLNYILMDSFDFTVTDQVKAENLLKVRESEDGVVCVVRREEHCEGNEARTLSHEQPVLRVRENGVSYFETECSEQREFGPQWRHFKEHGASEQFKCLLSTRDYIFRLKYETTERVALVHGETARLRGGRARDTLIRVVPVVETESDLRALLRVSFWNTLSEGEEVCLFRFRSRNSMGEHEDQTGNTLQMKLAFIVCSKHPVEVEPRFSTGSLSEARWKRVL